MSLPDLAAECATCGERSPFIDRVLGPASAQGPLSLVLEGPGVILEMTGRIASRGNLCGLEALGVLRFRLHTDFAPRHADFAKG